MWRDNNHNVRKLSANVELACSHAIDLYKSLRSEPVGGINKNFNGISCGTDAIPLWSIFVPGFFRRAVERSLRHAPISIAVDPTCARDVLIYVIATSNVHVQRTSFPLRPPSGNVLAPVCCVDFANFERVRRRGKLREQRLARRVPLLKRPRTTRYVQLGVHEASAAQIDAANASSRRHLFFNAHFVARPCVDLIVDAGGPAVYHISADIHKSCTQHLLARLWCS